MKRKSSTQVKWKYMKLNIKKFTILCTRIHTKNNRKIKKLENKLKDLENNSNNYDIFQKYNKIKFELEEL